jgi:hypothetical protein
VLDLNCRSLNLVYQTPRLRPIHTVMPVSCSRRSSWVRESNPQRPMNGMVLCEPIVFSAFDTGRVAARLGLRRWLQSRSIAACLRSD